MESNKYKMDNNNIENHSGKIWAGVFFIGIGAVLLLRNMGLALPSWLFSWSMLLVVIGLFIGLKHRFRNSGWIIMVIIGGYFTLEKAFDHDFDFHRVGLPLLLVTLGLFLIFKPKDSFKKRHACRKFKKNRFDKDPLTDLNDQTNAEGEPLNVKDKKAYSQDFLDSVNVFGGSNQTVYSKNFKGGEITAVFGGCDVNLTQADFEGTIEIDVTAVFGGCKIIVPAGWQVKSEVTAIFGGLDDKRGMQPATEGTDKLLVIRGVAMFGGVDIRNF